MSKSPTPRALRAIGHHLKPVVTIGDRGLTEAVIAATDDALRAHELIKVKLPAGDRDARADLVRELTTACAAQAVQTIGRVCLLFRPEKDAGATSNLVRFAAQLGLR